MSSSLPDFRYHPDPIATGSIAAADVECPSCGRQCNYVYVGSTYGIEDLHDRVCPWCIADGSAARRFDATFTDDSNAPADVPPTVLDEIVHRTPGFTGWQQEHWLYHCRDAAAFLGRAGYAELAAHPDAVDAVRDECAEWGMGAREIDEYVESLDPEGSATGYLFRCLHCGTHLAYTDFE